MDLFESSELGNYENSGRKCVSLHENVDSRGSHAIIGATEKGLGFNSESDIDVAGELNKRSSSSQSVTSKRKSSANAVSKSLSAPNNQSGTTTMPHHAGASKRDSLNASSSSTGGATGSRNVSIAASVSAAPAGKNTSISSSSSSASSSSVLRSGSTRREIVDGAGGGGGGGGKRDSVAKRDSNSSAFNRKDSFTTKTAFDDEITENGNRSPVFRGHRSKSEGKLCNQLNDSINKTPEPFIPSQIKLSKRESLKVQKKHYRREKKRAAKELLCTLKDPSVIVLADWLKVRGTLKGWTKMWCVLKPGLLVLYKSHKQKSSHWVGTILLNTCELIERPSKKDGFCFKVFHPLDQSIWATKGPKGETIGALTQPLPYSYLIFRAPSEAAGKCWMDALELALRCSSLLIRSMTKDKDQTAMMQSVDTSLLESPSFLAGKVENLNESDCERHFKDVIGEDYKTDRDENKSDKTDSESEPSEDDEIFDDNLQPLETPYEENTLEELGTPGDACQTEEVAEENKSLIWMLVKQVRPGMDLSKVVLPTFILEPRSFLDKLSDYYYHADLLAEAVKEENPFTRMKQVVRWYLSGFYKKPKGLKKPYNPILGETFRCYWKSPKTGSRTFYVAEQISHHPPVSAFHITNRKDGYCVNGSILAKSKFYGNSLSAILDGAARLSFLKRGEDYLITMPYAHCKGILIGTLSMEYGGKIFIDCEKTGYKAELEFKLKPFLGAGEHANKISGKIKLGSETLATLDGHWDAEVFIKDKMTGESQLFWNPSAEVRASRLKRYTVPLETQHEHESQRLWIHVSDAISRSDNDEATNEKSILEEAQRLGAKERKAKGTEWTPRYFERDLVTGDWIYKFADSRPWDPMNDVLQYENDYVIQTKTRHKTPIVRASSILSVEETNSVKKKLRLPMERARSIKQRNIKHLHTLGAESGSSTPDPDICSRGGVESDSSDSAAETRVRPENSSVTIATLQKALAPLIEIQDRNAERLASIQSVVMTMRHKQMEHNENSTMIGLLQPREWLLMFILLISQSLLYWAAK
ncbi:oxysterol-binding protein-related protein 8-like isoform X3 [Tubulanus polymorphus]|uniref:oxysterol-binding protein-related protein 8-like isoform X3 n=1 Tax=Tubulanus polymorphus TaxID=672921 RepID=UPI003DA21797